MEPQGTWTLGRLYTGRIGRIPYILGALFLALPLAAVSSVWTASHSLLIMSDYLRVEASTLTVTGYVHVGLLLLGQAFNVNRDLVFVVLFVFAMLFWFIGTVCLTIRRCHDFGYSGWLSVGTFIPYAGLIFGAVNVLKAGDATPNEYGAPSIRARDC